MASQGKIRSGVLTPAQAREIYAYNERLFERYVTKIRRLPEQAARRREGIGHETLFNTLVHILNVHEVWLGYILQGRSSDPELRALFLDPSRQPRDWTGFRRYNRRVWQLVHRYLESVTARNLAQPVRVFWMAGRYVAADGILQATFEQAHHLGEIIGVLRQHDIEPPEMAWIRMRGRAAARRSIPQKSRTKPLADDSGRRARRRTDNQGQSLGARA